MDYLKSTSLKKLEQLYKEEKDPKVKTKLLVVIHKKENKKLDTIAETFRINLSTVTRTIKRFRKEGLKGLYRKHAGGNPSYLTDNQKQQLIKHIEENTPTSRGINQYIQDNFGKSYHPFALPKFLKSLDFSRITPRKQHYKTDKAKQKEWKSVFKKRQNNKWVWVIQSSSKTNQ